jgi:4-diphosphocytidyl-2-C-methyl-D-erythritol kinase
MGLSRLWEIEPEIGEMRRLAASLGSDVPFFLHGGTAIGTGRGTDIEELSDIECDAMIIVMPDAAVSTGDAFAAANVQGLTTAESNRILFNYRFWAETGDLRQMVTANDFEDTVFRTYPEVARAKRKLLELGALNAGLSGSGASVFGIFENQETRQTALKALGDEANWRSFAVAAVSRAAYREALGIV